LLPKRFVKETLLRLSKNCHPLQAILLSAGGYYALASLSSFLSIPPSSASAVWPAAGLVIIFILEYSWSGFFGSFLGAFLYNAMLRWQGEALLELLASDVLVSAASCLQALLAAKLVQRLLMQQSSGLLPERRIMTLLLLCGPLCCLLAPSIAIVSFYLQGMAFEALRLTWFTWWVGDSIGVMVVMPIYLMYLGLRERAETDLLSRTLKASLPYLMILILTIALFSYARNVEQQKHETLADQHSEILFSIIADRLGDVTDVVLVVHSWLASQTEVDTREFEVFLTPLLAHYSGLQALEWVPKILPAQRRQFEAELSERVGQPHTIVERQIGGLTEASEKAHYFPVAAIAPMQGNEPAFGFDLASNPSRLRTLNQSVRTGEVRATEAIHLVQDDEGRAQLGFLLFMPLFDRDSARLDRISEPLLRGFALGVYRINDLFNAALVSQDLRGFNLRISDITMTASGEEPTLLYLREGPQGVAHRWVEYLEIGGRRWAVEFSMSKSVLWGYQNWSTWLVLMGGLLFVAISGALILSLSSRTESVTREVAEKTLALNLALDKAEAASKAKSAFLASMSHELRTPLNSIIGFTYRVRRKLDKQVSRQILESLDAVHRNGQHLLRLINEILDLSKIEAGRMSISCEQVPLNVLCATVASQVEALVSEQPQTFRYQCQVDRAYADPLRLTQMLLNLVSNALKYSDYGEILLTVSAQTREHKGSPCEGVCFSVEDEGRGIKSEDLNRLFRKFSQLGGFESDYVEGTGLGLALVKEFTSLHGGEVSVSSEWGKGSCFSFWLPQAAPEHSDECSV